MKGTPLLLVAAVIAVGALAGSFYLNRPETAAGSARAERRIGEQGPGPTRDAVTPTWTPERDPDGYTVTRTLPITDSRVARFADFPLLLPDYLPPGSQLDQATLIWDPATDKRVVQISIQGRYNGILTEQRIRDRGGEYPDGILIRTETPTNGAASRNLLSNVDGIGVSMAWNPSLPDEEIIKSFQSLKPQARS